jgi:hypothetical protein
MFNYLFNITMCIHSLIVRRKVVPVSMLLYLILWYFVDMSHLHIPSGTWVSCCYSLRLTQGTECLCRWTLFITNKWYFRYRHANNMILKTVKKMSFVPKNFKGMTLSRHCVSYVEFITMHWCAQKPLDPYDRTENLVYANTFYNMH